jgi:hypothetical protein
VDGRALTRLRIAFLLLGAALLLPLALLLRSVDSRLEAQRRLRHELVAERIFDEMEGELTALLSREEARPSDAYVGAGARVENWAPFVVGYFTRDARGAQIVAKPQLAPERLHRLEATLQRVGRGTAPEEAHPSPSRTLGTLGIDAPAAAPSGAFQALEETEGATQPTDKKAKREARSAQHEPAPAKAVQSAKGLGAAAPSASDSAQRVQPLPEAILKQLNRAADVREREQSRPASKRKATTRSDHSDTDPLSGFE